MSPVADHGGYRQPANPAPVSGPGKYSKRTDGQVASSIPGQDYGQKSADMASQQQAPMAAQQPVPSPAAPSDTQPDQASAPPYQGGDFGGPTSRPDEPVTAGAPAGPGPGPEVLGSAPEGPAAMPTGYLTSVLQQLAPGDTTGTVGDLLVIARQRGV